MSVPRAARSLWIVAFIFVAATSSDMFRHAIGQTSKTSIPASFDYSKLADAIQGSFPIAGVTAYVGNDWCFQVETDTSKNWWYFNYKGLLTAYPSEYGSRIRVLYKDANNNWDGASIFIAFETLVPDHYNIPTNIRHEFLKNRNTITFPVSPYTSCPPLKDFLTAIFAKYWTNWRIWGDPGCDDLANDCGTVENLPVKQTGQIDTDDGGYLYWSFNGRFHKISGAMRFLIDICTDPKQYCDDLSKRVPIYGYLYVGYGGNGGAG